MTEVQENIDELWEPIFIKGQETKYKVSSLGRVISNYRGPERILTPIKIWARGRNKTPYLRVFIYLGDYRTPQHIHRLVALHFLPNPNNWEQVNHIDGDTSNNRVENLEWCTQAMNQQHAVRIGLHVEKRGGENAKAKPVGKYLNGILVKKYGCVVHAKSDGFGASNLLCRALKTGRQYKGFTFKYL